MITNLNKVRNKSDIKFIMTTVIVFLIALWFCTPPGNKLAQICFYGNNTRFFIAKLTKPNSELNEWVFHRNNAVYLTKMENKKAAIHSIELAKRTLPDYASKYELSKLYADSAQIKLYFGDTKGALNDFLRTDNPSMLDMLKIAMLYKKVGQSKYALSYCNTILNMNSDAYIGYACTANVYASAGRQDIAIKIYDILINKFPNNATYYSERAALKNEIGDLNGSSQDLEKAKEISPVIGKNFSLIREAEKPSRLTLTIM